MRTLPKSDLHPVVADVGDLEGVVEEYVRLELVVVRVDDLEVFLCDSTSRLVLVHPANEGNCQLV